MIFAIESWFAVPHVTVVALALTVVERVIAKAQSNLGGKTMKERRIEFNSGGDKIVGVLQLPDGEVVVLHQGNRDAVLRAIFSRDRCRHLAF